MTKAKHTATALKRYRLTVHGRVQGVGFRPTFYRALTERACAGSIRNTPEGVVLEVEAPQEVLEQLVRDFRDIAPARARVDELIVQEVEPLGERGFRIEKSADEGRSLLPIPPDLATCDECKAELHTAGCRRRGYAFNTCTACGPRFTIAHQVPFDRATNAMNEFPPCPACAREYSDPADRRLHAQTLSCPDCGPSLMYLTPDGEGLDGPLGSPRLSSSQAARDKPLERTRRMLKEGQILAIKGIGGFHLACDATRQDVVSRLRERKGRPAKPFAIMVPDLETCERICCVSEFEKGLLTSAQTPVVLLKKRPDCFVADAVAPGLADLGVMLPYTPLHVMLFEGEGPALSEACPEPCRGVEGLVPSKACPEPCRGVEGLVPSKACPEPCRGVEGPALSEVEGMPPALVMTSCNRSEEPIAITHQHVLEELSDLVDGILTHNRRITNRCDDSVVAALGQRVLPMRRSRGYVPEPVVLEEEASPILACGGMLKNAFALTSGRRVFLSQHIGDVSDADNAAHFARAFADFSRLLRLEPEIVVCDMHPDYPTTEFARQLSARRDLPLVQVQHQHAHIVSCLAENGHQGPVIGVAWDGSGYGEDGAVWGGEFLIADRRDYERRYHLEYVPMPGGERAIWNPCRMAAAHLAHAIGPEEAVRRMAPRMNKQECELALQVMDKRDFSPLTSSAGRLFDAVSALLGIRPRVTYEGQAACELEARCKADASGSYAFGYAGEDILLGEMWRGICEDLDRGLDVGVIATKFHNTMARVIVETCVRLRGETGLGTVALSGGVMQNRTLLGMSVPALEAEGFKVLVQTVVPPNDGGLCLGQAACAMARLNSRSAP